MTSGVDETTRPAAITPAMAAEEQPASLTTLGLMTVLIGVFLPMTDFFIVNVALPTIDRDLHAPAGMLQLGGRSSWSTSRSGSPAWCSPPASCLTPARMTRHRSTAAARCCSAGQRSRCSSRSPTAAGPDGAARVILGILVLNALGVAAMSRRLPALGRTP